jgi:hypothetical protein
LLQIFPGHVTQDGLGAISDLPELARSLLSLSEFGEAHLSLSLDEVLAT